MKSFAIIRYTLCVGAAVLLVAGCGASQPPIGGPGGCRKAPDRQLGR